MQVRPRVIYVILARRSIGSRKAFDACYNVIDHRHASRGRKE